MSFLRNDFGPEVPLHESLHCARAGRFWAGSDCVHCSGSRVVRWGGFAGRQRYRCRDCGRTFSDFTGTPLAYSKRVELWPRYAALMRDAATLRHSAALLGVHLSTSFRWRHALLAGALACDTAAPLTGAVELLSTRLYHNQKGKRTLGETARRHASPGRRFTAAKVTLLLALARHGPVFSYISPGPFVHRQTTAALLRGWIDETAIVFARDHRKGHLVGGVRAAELSCVVVPFSCEHPIANVTSAAAYASRFRSWLVRFRGVATRYLPHYLYWYGMVDGVLRSRFAARLLSTASRTFHQQFPRTPPSGAQAGVPPPGADAAPRAGSESSSEDPPRRGYS